MIDPRDFHAGPAPTGDPFEPVHDPAPSFGVGPEGIENLCRALGLPVPAGRGPVAEFGDPEAKW